MTVNFIDEQEDHDIHDKSRVREGTSKKGKNLQAGEAFSTSTRRCQHHQKLMRMIQEPKMGGENTSQRRRGGRH